MGKSKSIQEQQKVNQEFQEYVEKISNDMSSRQDKIGQTLEQMEQEHYENFPDKFLLMEGKYSHLTTISEWSLKSVSAIIDACSKALFGSQTPEGSDKKETDETVSASILAIKEREQFIANAAFDIVQSIVGDFKDTTSTSVERKIDGKPIAPGMTLFIGVENNAYSSTQFFSAEKIVQTIFVFRVCYSIKEGQAQSALSDLQVYEDQKEAFRQKIEELNDAVENLDIMDDDYPAKFQKLMDRADLLNQRMDVITEEIKKLTIDKITKERNVCNQLVEMMRDSGRLRSQNNTVYTAASTGFTYMGGRDKAMDKIRQWTPGGIWLQSLRQTDYVGYHFVAEFVSDSSIDRCKADECVQTAFQKDPEGFEFHFDANAK